MRKAIAITIGIITLIALSMIIIPYLRFIPEEIIQAPHKNLHKASIEVLEINEETKQIVRELKDVIEKVDGFWGLFGLGMAAPQIGYNKRILVLRTPHNEYQEMINPKVLEQKWLLPAPQMCFSTKGMHILNRYFWYRIQYLDVDGVEQIQVIKGLQAITLNQELDHLDGVLITD